MKWCNFKFYRHVWKYPIRQINKTTEESYFVYLSNYSAFSQAWKIHTVLKLYVNFRKDDQWTLTSDHWKKIYYDKNMFNTNVYFNYSFFSTWVITYKTSDWHISVHRTLWHFCYMHSCANNALVTIQFGKVDKGHTVTCTHVKCSPNLIFWYRFNTTWSWWWYSFSY